MRGLAHPRPGPGQLSLTWPSGRAGSGAGSVQFSTPLTIRRYPDPVLRAENEKVTVFDEKLEALAEEMFHIMYRTDGVGLAAPQIGANYRLMVWNPEGDPKRGKEYVLVNPELVKMSSDRITGEEGCLSFPKLKADGSVAGPGPEGLILGDVERRRAVRVEAQDLKGKPVRLKLSGWEAVIFQHEFDHLQGMLFHDRMAPDVFEACEADLRALERDFRARNPGAEVPDTASFRDLAT